MKDHLRHSDDDTRRQRAKRLRWAALGGVALWLAVFVTLATVWPDPYRNAWQPLIGQWTAGQAFAASHGLFLGLPKWYVVAQGVYQGLVLTLFLYSVILSSHGHLHSMRFIGPVVTRTQERAHRFRDRFGSYGIVLLLIFFTCPLWNTGPLAILIVGYLFGLRLRILFTTVALGNLFSLTVWVFFFDALTEFLERSGIDNLPPMPLIVLVVVISVAVLTRLARAVRARLRTADPKPLTADDTDAHG